MNAENSRSILTADFNKDDNNKSDMNSSGNISKNNYPNNNNTNDDNAPDQLQLASQNVAQDIRECEDQDSIQIQEEQKHLEMHSKQPQNRTTILNTTQCTVIDPPGSGGDDSGNNADSLPFIEPFQGPKKWRFLVQHWPVISQQLAFLLMFITLLILGVNAVPLNGNVGILFVFMGAHIAGIIAIFFRLPDMLGMLLFGVLYANVGLENIFGGSAHLEAFLREMALINILLLAGFGLDWTSFRRLWLMILRLSLVPTIAEVAVIALMARYLLSMPWLWGLLTGFVITAVSPNVVVTVMLKLKEDRLDLNRGIYTLIYATTTCSDIVAIFCFSVTLRVILFTDTLTEKLLQGPIGIAMGVVFGYVYGLVLQYIPSRKTAYVEELRFVLTVLGGAMSVMGSRAADYPSAGALGCAIIAIMAKVGWSRELHKERKKQGDQSERQQTQQQQGPSQQNQQEQQHAHDLYEKQDVNDENLRVVKRLDLLWKFLKPLSFALIGKEIKFDVLDGAVVGFGVLLVLLGSLFRLAFAYISTFGGNLSRKERAYIAISGFPKATVQAALGPIALYAVGTRHWDDEPHAELALAKNVLIISVLAIICTAPLGAVLMLRLAPRWLKRSQPLSAHGNSEQVFSSPKVNVKNFNQYAADNPILSLENGKAEVGDIESGFTRRHRARLSM